MKHTPTHLKQFAVILLCMIAVTACNRLPETAKTATFKVWGNCGMCKETIEKSVKTEGIYKADWNKDTKIMEIAYDTTMTNLAQIQQQIAAAGYDNEGYTGSDTAYSSLHKCCKYERKTGI